MKFSIITPSHKYQLYINDLYHSIINQSYTNWEWILYLNGDFKKDQLSDEILNDERVKVYTNYDNNTNIGYVKNKAFSLGTGDILVEMDHDDVLTSDCLEELKIAFENHPDCGFVYSDNATYHMKNSFFTFGKSGNWNENIDSNMLSYIDALLGTWSNLYSYK